MFDTDQLVGSSLSDVGVTRSENQDACGEFHNDRGERLWIVADGMGGHAGGVTASRMCIETMGRIFERSMGSPAELLRHGLEESNRAIHGAAAANPELHGMGTTAVGLVFDTEGKVWLGWVGDSRAYRLRDGMLERLSEDHSIVEQWVRMGRISAQEAETHPRRNELSRAIGPEPEVEVDVRSYDILEHDTYLLCSDGLCGYVPEARISEVVSTKDPALATRRLVDIVNSEYNSPDNVTVQIVGVPGADGLLASQIAGAEAAARATDTSVETFGEEAQSMANGSSSGGGAGYPRTRRTLMIGIALLIVAALLALLTYYAMESQQAEREAAERQRSEAARVAAEEDAQRLEREAAEAAAEAARMAAETQELERRAAAAEAARLETARKADEERLAAEAREAEIAAQIAATEAALAAEQAAAAEAQRIIDERERIIREQEERRQAELARAEEARRVEEAFNQARAVDSFVAQWTQALEAGDYELYRKLGFRETEAEFRSLYGTPNADYDIAVNERKQWVGGFVSLRVTESFAPSGAGNEVSPQETRRRVVLRPTSEGMRYAGDRE